MAVIRFSGEVVIGELSRRENTPLHRPLSLSFWKLLSIRTLNEQDFFSIITKEFLGFSLMSIKGVSIGFMCLGIQSELSGALKP